MAHYKKRKMIKRVSKRQYLEGKVRRAKKRESKDYWLNRLVTWSMSRGRSQSLGAMRGKWSFNKKRY